jgi:hypothetical protein
MKVRDNNGVRTMLPGPHFFTRSGRDHYADSPMVSVDHYKQELRAQMERSAAHGMPDILINAGELWRTLHGRIGPTDDCCEAMREESKPGEESHSLM